MIVRSSRQIVYRQKLSGAARVIRAMARGMDEFAAREIGARIAQARRERGLTQEELAMISSFSKRALQDYEAGLRVPYRHMRELSLLLGRSVEWFLHGDRSAVDGARLDRLEERLDEVLHAIEDLKTLVASEVISAPGGRVASLQGVLGRE
jgi:transcriptional regulator with XRE-family HTH domain